MRMRRIAFLALAATLAATALIVAAAPSAEAGCWPHVLLAREVKATPIPIAGGGTATAQAQVRGFFFPECITCMHGEANSNASVTIDYIYWGGAVYHDYGGGSYLAQQGSGSCSNCTGGYWKSQAFWFGEFDCWFDTYGDHVFTEGAWTWAPSTHTYYYYPGCPDE